jgi:L-aminopeptidase/D-esterase-like protein
VGQHTDLEAGTGCTVILPPPGTVGGVDVRGGAPGTSQTESLRPGRLVQEVHAVLLAGGSAFGLGASDGVRRYLEERGVGLDTRIARVPVVPTAILFDLGVGDASARPSAADAYAACERATADPIEEGSVGAGTGATVAKIPDPAFGVKGGLGSASGREGDLVVGALAAVNALGAIVAEDGRPIAASRAPASTPLAAWEATNTTLVVVATNARLSADGARRLAAAAHEGVSHAIRPAHTLWDGDTAFALATGEVEGHPLTLAGLAAETAAAAIRRGVTAATGLHGVPSVGEI